MTAPFPLKSDLGALATMRSESEVIGLAELSALFDSGTLQASLAVLLNRRLSPLKQDLDVAQMS